MNSLFSTVAAINSAAPASAPLAIKSVSHLAGVAMLAAVSISKWSAGKVDKRVIFLLDIGRVLSGDEAERMAQAVTA